MPAVCVQWLLKRCWPGPAGHSALIVHNTWGACNGRRLHAAHRAARLWCAIPCIKSNPGAATRLARVFIVLSCYRAATRLAWVFIVCRMNQLANRRTLLRCRFPVSTIAIATKGDHHQKMVAIYAGNKIPTCRVPKELMRGSTSFATIPIASSVRHTASSLDWVSLPVHGCR